MIQRERFDEADVLINGAGESALIANEFAHFHPSEAALGRLQLLLKKGNVSEKGAMAQARQCFHRLSSGCISGNEKAGQNLLLAAESIAVCASPLASTRPPNWMEVIAALTTVSKGLQEVLKILPSNRHLLFEEKRSQIEDQLATLRYVSNIIPPGGEEKHQFVRRFQGARNPGELFVNLMKNHYFAAAEGLWNSFLKAKIHPQVAVKAIAVIDTNADPDA